MLGSQNLNTRRVPLARRLPHTKIAGAAFIGDSQRSNGARRGALVAFTRRRDIARKRRSVCDVKFVRSDTSGQADTFASPDAKINSHFSVAIAPAFDKWRKFTRHRCLPK